MSPLLKLFLMWQQQQERKLLQSSLDQQHSGCQVFWKSTILNNTGV